MGLAALPLAAMGLSRAQAQGEADPSGGITIPEDVKLFGRGDPNVREATAIVNGAVITGTDVDHRLALIVAANDRPVSDEERLRLRMQVLRNLIDETLQIQAAKEQEIEVARDQVDEAYARVAAQNFGSDLDAMGKYLASIGSSPDTLKRQIEGELSWQRLLQRNVQPYVSVSDEEVNELLERLKASKGTDEYRLGEIYLSATPANRGAVFENAKQIVQQLRQGGSFVAYARQFSEASTAAVGGDLGWIRLGQLPSELATVTREMQPGQLVGPVEVPGGFSILYLIEKRQVLMADPRDAIVSLKQISIEFAPGTSEAQLKQRVARFAEGIKDIRGCGEADAKAAAMGASVVTNDEMRLRSLPSTLQDTLLNLSIGQSTPPFGSIDEGVRVLMLCGRDDPQGADGPGFDQIMTQLEDDRVGKRAQRYLRDLRRDAVIEYH